MKKRHRLLCRVGPWIALCSGLSACSFYDLDYDECLDTATPAECGYPWGAGGSAGDGKSTGGEPSGGGSGGGLGEAGSGAGAPIGGGGASGGQGSGGEAGAGATESSDPRINEVRVTGLRFVEIYNAGSAAIESNEVFVATGLGEADEGAGCWLPFDVPPEEVAVAVTDGGDCSSMPSPCVECAFSLIAAAPASTVYLLDEEAREIDSVAYPDSGSPGAPLGSQSWAALPDGSELFARRSPTPGVRNE